MTGIMMFQSTVYFILSMWAIVEAFKMHSVPMLDLYIAFFMIVYQTAQYGAIGMVVFFMATSFSIMSIGIGLGCIERPLWMGEVQSIFRRASGINLNRISPDELTKLEAHCGKVIDQNTKNFFQQNQCTCSIC